MGKVVVFGGGGFVGKQLLPLLGAHAAPSSSELDLTVEGAASKVAALVEDGDSVVMLSALTPEKGSAPELCVRNVRMVKELLAGLQGKKVEHCVYVSSDGVFPLSAEMIDERTAAAADRSYGHMHVLREQLMREHFEPGRLTILRPCAIYGEGDTHFAYGICRFVKTAREQGEISLFGGGEEFRDHVHVEDVARIVARAVSARVAGEFNVASGTSWRFIAIAERINALLGGGIAIHLKPRAVEITHRHMDVVKLWRHFPDLAPRSIGAGLDGWLAA